MPLIASLVFAACPHSSLSAASASWSRSQRASLLNIECTRLSRVARASVVSKKGARNQHGLSGAGFNVMLRPDRSIHWVTMPFFAVDSAVEPQNDTLWKGFNAGFFAADCRLENCGSSLGASRRVTAPKARHCNGIISCRRWKHRREKANAACSRACRELRVRALCLKKGTRNQHGLSGTGFNVMLRPDRSIHWVTMPFFAVDSCGFPTSGCPTCGCPINGAPQNDTLWKGFNAGFFAADCRLENCGSSLGPSRRGTAPKARRCNGIISCRRWKHRQEKAHTAC